MSEDTLSSLTTVGEPSVNNWSFIVLGVMLIGLILFVYYKKRLIGKKVEDSEFTAVIKVDDSNSVQQSTNETTSVLVEEQEKIFIEKETDKEGKKKPDSNNIIEPTSTKGIDIVEPKKEEERSNKKYIGYKPINVFAQTEPLNYPYVIMPSLNCIIKFPRKGRIGRKGYKEEDFKQFIERYFKRNFQVFDDRFLLTKNSSKPFEPDFTLIDERNGINIFLDIEIDEPYEGLNNIEKRQPTHFQRADINRNNAFKNRGWIVIRFAEIQVHQKPESCCLFIADVIKSINPNYSIPPDLSKFEKLVPLRQWTKEEAEKWSLDSYRETYLGIDGFGFTNVDNAPSNIEETNVGNAIEDEVIDEKFIPIESKEPSSINKLDKIYSAINSHKYLAFKFEREQTIVKPIKVLTDKLIAFCYVKNRERSFSIYNITNINIKDSYYTLKVAGPAIGLAQITNAVKTAITNHRLIRMKYTRSSWTNMTVDEETGELVIDTIEAEESIRTINDVQLSIDVLAQEQIEAYNLDHNHITAYCNKREEQRTFRFDRISEIEILNI